MNTKWLAIALALIVVAPAHAAADWCHPKDKTARVLQSPNPNDLHPDWRGESYIGTGWALAPGRSVTADGVFYIEGGLYSPRGGLVAPKIYVLRNEWDCED